MVGMYLADRVAMHMERGGEGRESFGERWVQGGQGCDVPSVLYQYCFYFAMEARFRISPDIWEFVQPHFL